MILLNNDETLQNAFKEAFLWRVLELKKRKSSDLLLFSSANLLDHSMTKYLKAEQLQLQLWQQY